MRTTAEILREEGQAKGVVLGRQEGELKNAQETLIDVANDLFAPLSNSLQAKIKSIQSIENLQNIAGLAT